ncbi:MAG TPA: DUF2269 family protein [Thermoleophilaceae bacterium]|nr:DUF2269 family protein [Thermoleophilaceae bacterium]
MRCAPSPGSCCTSSASCCSSGTSWSPPCGRCSRIGPETTGGAHAQRLVTTTDIAFTATGVVLIIVSGQVMANGFGGVFGPTWLTMGWALFIASGVIWVAILIPIQVLQSRLARRFVTEAAVPQRYWRLARLWAIFGAVATLLPLVNLYLMVFKPT